MQARSLAGTLALLLFLAAACNKQTAVLEQAKKQQAAGELDVAIVTLQTVRAAAPGSAEDAEAAKLATAWLLEAAAKAATVGDRKRRLEAALGWTPESGEAKARLCLALVEELRDSEAEQCLGEGMRDKNGVPEDVVREARSKLAVRKDAASEKERKALLASGREAQLKSLVERFPDSPEASQARDKLSRTGSLCADAASFGVDLRAQLAGLEKLAAGRVESARKNPDVGARIDEYEHIGKEATELGAGLKNKGINAEAHGVKPGEEKLRQVVHDGYWVLADLAGDVGDGLKRPEIESAESYDEHAGRTLTAFVAGLKKGGEKLRKELDAAEVVCKSAAPQP